MDGVCVCVCAGGGGGDVVYCVVNGVVCCLETFDLLCAICLSQFHNLKSSFLSLSAAKAETAVSLCVVWTLSTFVYAHVQMYIHVYILVV